MSKFGEILTQARNSKKISLQKASQKLLVKKENLEALEKEEWQKLPEPSFVKGYIISYAQFLKLDSEKMLALYRREFDESKFAKNAKTPKDQKNSLITPIKIRNSIFILAIATFIAYIVIQYSSILSSPDLEISGPQDDITVSIPIIQISGRAEAGSLVSIEGEFVPIDADGNFSFQYDLEEGRNTIEIIASKRLSPKSKIIRTIRLVQ